MTINQIKLENVDPFAVVILAAGLGKRMNQPELPKVLAQLKNKPLLAYVIDQVALIKPKQVVTIVGHFKEKVIDFVEHYTYDKKYSLYKFAHQAEQKGTGHAVLQSADYLKDFDGNVLILCGDVPLLKAHTLSVFINQHQVSKSDCSVLSVVTLAPTGYGRIIRDENKNFVSIVEEKDANDEQKLVQEINSGIYLVKASYLFEALDEVGNNNAQGEYYLTDIIKILKSKNKNVNAYTCGSFDELQGVNTLEDLNNLEKYFSMF
jgi:bifunctional UDP-N-acetylglucosamine pyrophosphorylase/glucosamine-1-phosphate N-acetyltransferase